MDSVRDALTTALLNLPHGSEVAAMVIQARSVLSEAQDALKAAHYALTTLSGLHAFDGAASGESFQIDESATLARLEAVLPPPPWEVPGGPLYVGREGKNDAEVP
jgi:hypothetical protein